MTEIQNFMSLLKLRMDGCHNCSQVSGRNDQLLHSWYAWWYMMLVHTMDISCRGQRSESCYCLITRPQCHIW